MADSKEGIDEANFFDESFGQNLEDNDLDPPVSDEEIFENLETWRAEFDRENVGVKEYDSPLSGVILNEDWRKKKISKVLLVFLGPPYDIVENREVGWNPFLKRDGTYVKTLTTLNNLMKQADGLKEFGKFPLSEFVKVDCFSHKVWKKSPEKTVVSTDDLKVGVELLRGVIQVLSPKVVVCFGKETSYAMHCLINYDNVEIGNTSMLKHSFSRNSMSSNYLNGAESVQCLSVCHPGFYNFKKSLTEPMYNTMFSCLADHIEFIEEDVEEVDEEDFEEDV